MNQTEALKKQLATNGITGLALDIDETLAWTIGYWVERMQEKFGNPEDLSVPEIIAKYRYTQNVPYWRTDEAIAWMDEHRNSNEIQEMLPLIQGADSAIQDIQKSIPIVAYMTTRPQVVVPGTEIWLKKHGFPSAPIFARPAEVHVTDGNGWKASLLQELYPRVAGIIDDNPSLVSSLSADYKGTVYLYDNAESPRQDIAVVACESWDKLKNIIAETATQAK